MQPDVIGGRYRVRSAIGRGGMGTVWLCTDEVLGRDVAVKQVGLLPGATATDTARAMREARSSAALNHRNVVTVFDVVQDGDRIWLVMEYVRSSTLSDLIREQGALPPERVAAIGAQVADGLAAAHAAGTTHRDVKPGNIFVGDDDHAKIGDFGIARHTSDEPLTQTGFMTGTASYFSPELASGGNPGPASDVWALGATLYAAVEGRPPYQSRANPVATLHEIVARQPPRPTRAGPLEPVLHRMLDRDPRSRWSMADAAHALRRLADPPPAAGAVPGPTTGTAPPAERSGRRRAAGWLLVAAVLAVLTVLAGVALLTGGGPDQHPAASGGTTASSGSSPSSHPSASGSPGSGSSPDPTGGTGRPRPSRLGRVASVRSYYRTVPGNLDAGWAGLGPNEQAQGRASYDGFWRQIRSVDVRDLTPVGGDTLDLTLTYHFRDGRVVRERQRLQLLPAATRYLINDDTVLSSQTLSS
ncbi:MAG: serine/threonine-protein kinase [Nocardioidaceae bacterium]